MTTILLTRGIMDYSITLVTILLLHQELLNESVCNQLRLCHFVILMLITIFFRSRSRSRKRYIPVSNKDEIAKIRLSRHKLERQVVCILLQYYIVHDSFTCGETVQSTSSGYGLVTTSHSPFVSLNLICNQISCVNELAYRRSAVLSLCMPQVFLSCQSWKSCPMTLAVCVNLKSQ